MASVVHLPRIIATRDEGAAWWISFPPNTVLDGSDAPGFAALMRESVAAGPLPVRVLVDMRNARGATAAYRAEIGGLLREHRKDIIIACYNQNGFMAAMVRLVAKGTGMPLVTFPDEAAARAWLARGGT